MGTPLAPAYANIILFMIECNLFNKLKFKPILYKRYIDDIIIITNNINDTIQYFNDFNKNDYIKFDSDSIKHGKSGIFLDLEVFIDNNNILQTKIYQKPINKFQYIEPTSYHSKSIIKNFIIQEIYRYKKYCSLDTDFINILNLFKNRLLKRGYTNMYIHDLLNNIPSREDILNNLLIKLNNNNNNKNNNNNDTIPVIFNAYTKKLFKFIKNDIINLPEYITNNLIYKNTFYKNNILIKKILTVFKNQDNLKNILINNNNNNNDNNQG